MPNDDGWIMINLDDDVFDGVGLKSLTEAVKQLARSHDTRGKIGQRGKPPTTEARPPSTLCFDEKSSRRPTIDCDSSTELYYLHL